jgi:hypothetical protein
MKRTLIALALTGLTLGANAAVASQNDFTLDAFWKRPTEATSVVAAEAAQDTVQPRKYEQVDGYNY